MSSGCRLTRRRGVDGRCRAVTHGRAGCLDLADTDLLLVDRRVGGGWAGIGVGGVVGRDELVADLIDERARSGGVEVVDRIQVGFGCGRVQCQPALGQFLGRESSLPACFMIAEIGTSAAVAHRMSRFRRSWA
ncbi:MAG: hypothetical protein ACRDRH_28825 [Pseudonocardia sp.]